MSIAIEKVTFEEYLTDDMAQIPIMNGLMES
jgi:hypothetical protein